MKISWGTYSDLELFEMVQKRAENHEKAFTELYERFSDRLFNYCYKILGSYADAKDVYQETFIKFFNIAPETILEGSVSGFLFRIARNIALNFNRKQKRYTVLYDEAISVLEKETESNDSLDIIAKALELLPIIQKEAFVLRHYQGLSYDEMEVITMTDQPTLRNRVKRAIMSLQRILKPYFKEVTKEELMQLKRKRRRRIEK